jgi:UDP:flavonoid glycosyltransferase YjiC (YdhE family)
MRIAYFTAGTIGAGHLTRGLAIGRALARVGVAATYRMFGPPMRFAAHATDDYVALDLQDATLLDAAAAAESSLARALAAFAPDLVVVDLYWLPLRHILPRLDAEAWLLLRSCPPAWLDGAPGHPFPAARYARVIGIEPALTLPHLRDHLEPIVIADPADCRPAGALRARLGVGADQALVAVLHTGSDDERLEVAPAAADTLVHTFDLTAAEALYPVCEWLHDADTVVCAAGYNSFWEAHWLGYHERTQFVPFRRKIDDQRWRIETCAGYRPRENGANQLVRWITGTGS